MEIKRGQKRQPVSEGVRIVRFRVPEEMGPHDTLTLYDLVDPKEGRKIKVIGVAIEDIEE